MILEKGKCGKAPATMYLQKKENTTKRRKEIQESIDMANIRIYTQKEKQDNKTRMK